MVFPIIRRRIRDLKDGVKNLGRTGSSKRFRKSFLQYQAYRQSMVLALWVMQHSILWICWWIWNKKYWQVLPVGPTSFGDSPYQSLSAFAGNPYLIDLDQLAREKASDAGRKSGAITGNTEICHWLCSTLWKTGRWFCRKHLVGLTNTNRNFSSL